MNYDAQYLPHVNKYFWDLCVNKNCIIICIVVDEFTTVNSYVGVPIFLGNFVSVQRVGPMTFQITHTTLFTLFKVFAHGNSQ